VVFKAMSSILGAARRETPEYWSTPALQHSNTPVPLIYHSGERSGLGIVLARVLGAQLFLPQRPPGERVFEIEILDMLFMTRIDFQSNLFD